MGRYIVKVPPPHKCEFPTVPSALGKTYETPGPGSIWECDCGKRWIYVGHPNGLWEAHGEEPDIAKDSSRKPSVRIGTQGFGLGLLRGGKPLDPG